MEMKGINLTNEINEFEAVNAETGLEIAVIGMSARLPGAQNIHEFWNNLKNGVESITYFSDEELKAAGVDSRLLENPAYVRSVGGIIKDKDYFDASFFGYTPKEAELMNPQARLFHECAWEALEDAGYDAESFEGLIGLYAGSNSSAYWEGKSLLSGKSEEIGLFAAGHLTNKDFSCMRVSYALNLRGPSINVFTACSTSLVAIHMASQELLSGQCDMALAGGVTLSPHLIRGYLYEEAMILSADGHCRAFAANAGGTCGGEGVGIVVLKNLGDALVDRDHIYAVIKGSAINNDGTGKVGFTAPGINGQVGVIKSCHRASGVEPESIGYIETHGTGTTLGDPIEFEALVRAFNTDKTGFCGIGSVKSNIGHVDAAAGAAGFIKTVLSLKHQQLPPSLHVETTNPKVDFENSPFYVNTKLSQWNNGRYPLRAGVSSFGIGGTNAHVVLEQAPVIGDSAPGREWQLLLLSAKTAAALEKITGNLASYFKENPTVKLADAAYTLKVGRRAFKHRRILICRDIDEAVDKLSSPGPGKTPGFSLAEEKEKRVVFMFPGLGSQYVNMGRGLYEKEPVFREEMDRCFELLRPIMGYDIKEILYPEDGDEELKKLNQGDSIERSAADMNRAGNPGNPLKTIETFEIAQIVIFIFEYALAKLLIKWGITPGAMIGYSFGEYAAACISGVYSLEDGLKLVVARGQLIESLPAGAMLSVPLPREQVIPLLDASPGLSLAIDNGPSCIAAGSVQGVAEFEKRLKQEKLLFMRLHTSRALHSQMMEPILVEFEEILKQFTFNKPQIP
jgi:acyl transferase domain-containing protein